MPPRISSRPRGSSPAAGSSSTSTSGSIAMTPAIAARLFCPPDRSNGDLSSSSGESPQKLAASSTRRAISASSSPMLRGPNEMSRRTVSSNSWYSGYWNTSPTLNANRCTCFGSAQTSSPPTKTCPDVGRFSPFRSDTSVDLPEPVCPIRPVMTPPCIVSDTSSSATLRNGVSGLYIYEKFFSSISVIFKYAFQPRIYS